MRRLRSFDSAGNLHASSSLSGANEQHPSANQLPPANNGDTPQLLPPKSSAANDEVRARLAFLPAYPSFDRASKADRQDHLLLSNVARQCLTNEQRRCYERRNDYPSSFRFIDDSINQDFTSFFVKLYRGLFVQLSSRLHINDAVIDYNYQRLVKCLDSMTAERIAYGLQKHASTDGDVLPLHEYAIALEFFLQIDHNIFFMKTCSFRGAMSPLSSNYLGLFCLTQPYASHRMTACQRTACRLCFPSPDTLDRIRKYHAVVNFSSSQEHRFVSGYRSILNCPVTCETKGILYVLTCPCGEYDYVGYTSLTLGQRLKYHREHGNRIIHEFILGQENTARIQTVPKSFEELVKDGMLLYKHSARCPVAMQLFLDCNPQYWPLIPMLAHEAQQDNQLYRLPDAIPANPTSLKVPNARTRSDHEAGSCMTALPPFALDKYTFSTRQCARQFQYFKEKQDYRFPNMAVDLYNATIIAVLPEPCSTPLYRIVEALVVTHAQTKLNTLGHLERAASKQSEVNHSTRTSSTLDVIADRGNWCHNLQRPPLE